MYFSKNTRYFFSSTISTFRLYPSMCASPGNNRMPYVSRNHALVSMSVLQFFSPSFDSRHFCIFHQKSASPRMVSNLFFGVEYKSLLKITHGAWLLCHVLLRLRRWARHWICAWYPHQSSWYQYIVGLPCWTQGPTQNQHDWEYCVR